MNCKLKQYLVRMIVGFSAYVLAVVAAHYFYTRESLHSLWPVFLLPVIPIIYIVAGIIRYVAEGLDELQRKVVTEGAAFSGIATGFTCISYLFFENAGAPRFHADWAFYMMWVYYGIGLMVSSRRYR